MVKPILSNLIMELNWMALLLKVTHREKNEYMILNQCIVLQTSTPNVKTMNLPAHPFQQKITLTPESYLGVSYLVHINLKCVTIIFQPFVKNWPDHKSGIMLFLNWSLCKKKVIFTNLFFHSGNCTRSNQVQCPGSSKCIPTRYLCNGRNDCGDSSRSDEQGCRWLILSTFFTPVFCHKSGIILLHSTR